MSGTRGVLPAAREGRRGRGGARPGDAAAPPGADAEREADAAAAAGERDDDARTGTQQSGAGADERAVEVGAEGGSRRLAAQRAAAQRAAVAGAHRDGAGVARRPDGEARDAQP